MKYAELIWYDIKTNKIFESNCLDGRFYRLDGSTKWNEVELLGWL